MEVITIETKAFYALAEEVANRLSKKMEVKESNNKWIQPAEAEKLLYMSSSQLLRLRNAGKIRFTKPSYKKVLYDRNSIFEYLEKNARDTF
ncbi:MAG: DNA-binding protein [Bacteroidetes bacterium]|nr:MAG: DNA-binding protein [Bacteroidota bacterium]